MGNTLPQAISVNKAGANVLNADLFAAQDFSQYTQVNIQVSGTFVGTLTFQSSKDWVTYSTCPAPVVASDVPVITIPVAASSYATYQYGRIGDRFSAGIGLAATGALLDTDATNTAAGAVIRLNYI